MQRTLNREDCDDENVHKFMFLLKIRTNTQIDEFRETNEMKFRKVAQQAEPGCLRVPPSPHLATTLFGVLWDWARWCRPPPQGSGDNPQV